MRRLILIAAFAGFIFAQPLHADSKEGKTFSSSDGSFQLVTPDGWEAADFPVDNIRIGAQNKKQGEYVEVIVENLSDYTDSIVKYTEAKGPGVSSS